MLKSFLGTFGSIFADSGLHDMIQLIYPGELTADSILSGNSFDKAIRAHLLIDAAILQHVLPSAEFSQEELYEMKMAVEHAVKESKDFNHKNFPVIETVRKKILQKFEDFKKCGRTPSLWALYH